jgi:transcriptional regulator with XRE-family HTH domain
MRARPYLWSPTRLRSLREAQGISQTKLATLAGVDRSEVCLWESDRDTARRPGLDNVLRLATALGVTVEELVG